MLEPKSLKAYYTKYGHYPAVYYEEPSLTFEERVLRDMFNELATERTIEGGYIPHSKIKAFCDYYKADFDRILYIMRRIESEVYKILREDR